MKPGDKITAIVTDDKGKSSKPAVITVDNDNNKPAPKPDNNNNSGDQDNNGKNQNNNNNQNNNGKNNDKPNVPGNLSRDNNGGKDGLSGDGARTISGATTSGKSLPNTGEENLALLPAVAWTALAAGVLAYSATQRKKDQE